MSIFSIRYFSLMLPVIRPLRGIINRPAPILHRYPGGYGEGVGIIGIHQTALDAGVDAKAIRPGKRAAGKFSVYLWHAVEVPHAK